jgi:peptide/nickel transport system permease protein
MIVVLVGVVLLIFTLMNTIPGNPVQLILGSNATEEDVLRLEEELGLHDPFFKRFFNYLSGIITRFDFGSSYRTRKPVVSEIVARFPYTLKLALLSTVVSTIIGMGCGIVAATKQYSLFDGLATTIALLGVSMPIFWLALMLILFFSIYINLLPVSGSYGWQYWVLPVATVGLTGAASIMRTTRSSMLETIRQDYIRTALAKGESKRVVIFRHAFKNAFIPIITVIGMQFGGFLGGSVISETVFAIPGIGKYTIDAIKQRDQLVVMGSILFLSFCVCFINLVVDLLYCVIDPRVKVQYDTQRNFFDFFRKEKETNDQ